MNSFIPPCILDSHLYRVTNTRCRIGTVFSPNDGHIVARNMQRKATNILRKFVHQVGSVYKRLYRDARSTKHKIYITTCPAFLQRFINTVNSLPSHQVPCCRLTVCEFLLMAPYSCIEHTLLPTRLLILMDANTTYHTITAYITVFLQMNPRVRNMQKTKIKIKLLIQKMSISFVYIV